MHCLTLVQLNPGIQMRRGEPTAPVVCSLGLPFALPCTALHCTARPRSPLTLMAMLAGDDHTHFTHLELDMGRELTAAYILPDTTTAVSPSARAGPRTAAGVPPPLGPTRPPGPQEDPVRRTRVGAPAGRDAGRLHGGRRPAAWTSPLHAPHPTPTPARAIRTTGRWALCWQHRRRCTGRQWRQVGGSSVECGPVITGGEQSRGDAH